MSLVCNYCGSDDIFVNPDNTTLEYYCNACQDTCQPMLEEDYLKEIHLGDCCC